MNWVNSNFYYLLLMLLSISYPFIRSFEHRLAFYKNWKALFTAIGCMMIVFISWDIIFTYLGIWSFNDRYILGIKFLYLPLEEWLFFICVPYACVFIDEVLAYFFPLEKNRPFIKAWNLILAFSLLILALIFWNRMYTGVCLLLTSSFLFLVQRKNSLFLTRMYRTYFVSLIPFLVVNGILTGAVTQEPIVLYNDVQNTGLRVISIPIEDFAYCLFMLSLTLWVYNYLKKSNSKLIEQKKAPKSLRA